MTRAKKGQNEVVRPKLHQNELGIIILALDETIEHTPKGYVSYPAFCRVRRKLALNRNSVSIRLEDHRHLVPWVKHDHGSKEADEEAARAKAEADRIASEKEVEKERLEREKCERINRVNKFVEEHNEAVSIW